MKCKSSINGVRAGAMRGSLSSGRLDLVVAGTGNVFVGRHLWHKLCVVDIRHTRVRVGRVVDKRSFRVLDMAAGVIADLCVCSRLVVEGVSRVVVSLSVRTSHSGV